MRARRRAWAACALAVAGAALAGCGGGGGGGGDGTGTGATAPGPAVRTVVRTAAVPAPTPLPAGRFDPERIYRRDSPGVVTVISLLGGNGAGQGSGFVISRSGEVVTNAHVVTDGEGSALRRASRVYVQFADRNEVGARIVGVDPNADVALLRVDPKGLDLRPLPLGRPGDVQVGEPVAAIGSPYGEVQSLSVGVVSAVHRSIESLTGFAISGAIQTDAAINKGNSGGPLLDARGRVLGINSQIKTTSGAGSGVGFAVDAGMVRQSLEQLRRTGRARYAYLGVSTTNVYPQLARRFGLGTEAGAWVQEVTPNGPAGRAGIRGGSGPAVRFQVGEYRAGGDVIVGVGAKDVTDDTDVGRLLEGYRPGQEVPVRIVRDGRPLTIRVKAGERPAATTP